MRRRNHWFTFFAATAAWGGLLACSTQSGPSGAAGAGGSAGSTTAGSGASAGGGSGPGVGAGGNVAACPDVPAGNGGTPELGAAAVISGDTVCLAFTEAMAPTGSAAPGAFRLSRAVLEPKGTTYYVLCGCPSDSCSCNGNYVDGGVCASALADQYGSDYLYANCVAHTATEDATLYYDIGAVPDNDFFDANNGFFDALGEPSSRHLVGTLKAPFDSRICGHGDKTPALYLHFADLFPSPEVRSVTGEPLAAIAPAWVVASVSPVREAGLLASHPVPVDAAILDVICAGP